jgi:hypothetical protein
MTERERSGIPWAHELVLHLGILVALAVLVLLCCVGCVTPDRGNAPVGTSEVSTAVVATLTGVAVATPRPTFTATPVPTATTMPTSTSTSRCDLGAAFVRDVTVPDNTSVEPGGKFTKTWELQNKGTCHWGDGVRLEHIDGERMAKSGWVAVPRTMAGESAEVSVEMQAPKEVGTYKSTWRMCTEQGECFGDAVYVQIVVQAPTPTSAPTSTPKPTVPQPIVLQGSGQAATDAVALPAPISIARFTHTGSANFIVTVYQGDESDLLINEIGPYQGARPLSGREPVIFDIDADGSWTVRIEPMGRADSAAFSGRGDAVSGLFDPPGMGPWQIKHNGQANFIVYSHCAGGSDLMQNEIGGVDGSRVVQFSRGPCFWEVQADGDWSLAPR